MSGVNDNLATQDGENMGACDGSSQQPSESWANEPDAGYASNEAGRSAIEAKADEAVLREEQLARTIEAEIIPRLLLAHLASRTMKMVRVASDEIMLPQAFSNSKISAFSDMVVREPLNVAVRYVDGLIAEGMTTETVILEVLSPTARNLGTLWEGDDLSFVDVTLGLSRLQQLLRVYGPAFEADFAPQHQGHRILLAAMPGEQHTFGMSVVEEFFRRDGWDVQTEAKMTRSDLLSRARDEWFDVVGLSANSDASVAQLASLIKAIRDAALNRHIKVIVGGCAFLTEPANALALGADLVACNGKEAVLNVERLLDPTKNL